jgi:hypothetical protein
MVVYIYNITAAGNSVSSQVGSSCQGNWYGKEKAGGTLGGSHSSSQPGGPPCWASPLAFGLSTLVVRVSSSLLGLIHWPVIQYVWQEILGFFCQPEIKHAF